MKKSLFYLLSFAPLSGGDFSKDVISHTPQNSGWTASYAVGPNYRHFGDVRYQGQSQSQNLLVPSFIGGNSLTLPPIGTTGTTSDRLYDNGFVNLDGGTADNGLTWNWGYDSTDQVQANSLTYGATGYRSDYSESSSYSAQPTLDSDLKGAGLMGDIYFAAPENFSLPISGVLVSLSYFGTDQNFGFSSFSGQQQREDYRLDFTDTFDTTGLIIPLRDDYEGTYAGPGPKIDNIPSSRVLDDVLLNTENASFANSVSSSIELNALSLAVGPTIQESFDSGWAWQISFGATVNLYKWSASQSESLSVRVDNQAPTSFARFNHSSSQTDWALGLFGRVGVTRELPSDWYTSVHFQGDLGPTLDVRVGPSKYEIETSGYSAGFLIGRRF
ncbi:hypothetical protein AAFN60_20120 [Roseibacillus persicicus]|uniref:hypothetical protein n=1 Tax=Roseibacillus persicicus TaxID=454148 RepID=UPI00398B6EB2